jgi:hypothetical protein
MSEEVRYEVKLDGTDKFEHGIDGMKHHANEFHEAMGELKKTLIEFFAIEKIMEFGEESFKEFEKNKTSVAELTQMYNNNSKSVSLNLGELKELAEQQEKLTGIHSESTMAAEENLMKFKDIKVSYEEIIPLAGDMAKQFGGIENAANMLGRAMEDPKRAMRLLVQAGVSPEQQQMFQNLEKTGQAAKAQAFLMDTLKGKYEGLAKAAYDADLGAQFEIATKEIKESVGELIEKGFLKLVPYIKAAFDKIKEFVEWLKDHEQGIKEFATVIGIATTAFGLYWAALKIGAAWTAIVTAYTVIMESTFISIASAYDILTAAQWAINAAMTANPIGLIIAAIAALVIGIYEAYQHFETFRKIVDVTWVAIKSFGKVLWDDLIFPFTSAYHVVAAFYDVLSGDFAGAEGHMKAIGQNALDMANDVANGIRDIQLAANGEKMVNEVHDKPGTESSFQKWKRLQDEKNGGKKDKSDVENKLQPAQSSSVTGTKQVIINVTIQRMNGIEKLVVESMNKVGNTVGEGLLKALTGATNQWSASTDI